MENYWASEGMKKYEQQWSTDVPNQNNQVVSKSSSPPLLSILPKLTLKKQKTCLARRLSERCLLYKPHFQIWTPEPMIRKRESTPEVVL